LKSIFSLHFLFFVTLVFFSQTPVALAKFPQKTIKLVVYTKPGGAIDVFARKFQSIAQKHSKADMVVINKSGAGGIVALKYLKNRGGDGHMIAAVTKSNIGKIVSSQSDLKVDDFQWMASMVSDPEAVIVNANSKVSSWKALVAKAKEAPGKQVWVGPAMGGNDHITAMKIWKALGVQGKWVPYSGGGKAMAALMGEHGDAYVGNPGDVIGKPNLKVVAVSSTHRLGPPFESVPTFAELGLKGLDHEIMWRGFIAKKGLPKEVQAFYKNLFEKVHNDPEWIQYVQKLGANSVFSEEGDFLKQVLADQLEFTGTLKALKVIN
jgi:tripartite-type tricarboxylate transporter receptor subunit TctC